MNFDLNELIEEQRIIDSKDFILLKRIHISKNRILIYFWQTNSTTLNVKRNLFQRSSLEPTKWYLKQSESYQILVDLNTFIIEIDSQINFWTLFNFESKSDIDSYCFKVLCTNTNSNLIQISFHPNCNDTNLKVYLIWDILWNTSKKELVNYIDWCPNEVIADIIDIYLDEVGLAWQVIF